MYLVIKSDHEKTCLSTEGTVVMQIRPLTEALAEVARVELNENPNRREEYLRSLKDWIRKQPHLRARTDDQWLVAFLRGCKWSLERAKEKIDIYYTLRSIAPDLFCLHHRDPKVMDILDQGVGLVLPKAASPTAPRVILVRPGCYEPDQYTLMEIVAVTAMQQQIAYMEDDNLNVSGLVHVVDLQGTKLSHIIHVTPLQIKKIATLNQDAAPTRMKATYFVNMAPYLEAFFNLAKSFLNEKNRQRIHVHGKNDSDLHKHVPKEILPIEYGGHDYSIQDVIDNWKKKFQQYDEWFEEDLRYGTEESKRLGKSKADAMFGVEGSFKSLDFD